MPIENLQELINIKCHLIIIWHCLHENLPLQVSAVSAVMTDEMNLRKSNQTKSSQIKQSQPITSHHITSNHIISLSN
jgi:hypothetical protein